MAAQMVGKDGFAGCDDLFFGHLRETEILPGGFRALDDESRGVGVELIDMRPYPSMICVFEDEGKCVVKPGLGAKPDEFTGALVDFRLKRIGKMAANG